jgi:hypothetical protein
MSKQSSVQWLFQQLWDTPKDKFEWQSIFLMAHQMHQEEIIESYCQGCLDMTNDDTIFPRETSEQYYNEKFNQ